VTTMSLMDIQEECRADSVRWFGEEICNDLKHQLIGLTGEVGEFANIVKKVDRGSLPFEPGGETHMMMAMELIDVFIYLVNCANTLGMDLEGNYKTKRAFNEERFSETSQQEEG
jgi:NTP pyrophosphatase (non-canonical NTP hydrolase)